MFACLYGFFTAWTGSGFGGHEPGVIIATETVASDGLDDARMHAAGSVEIAMKRSKLVGWWAAQSNCREICVRTNCPLVLPVLERASFGLLACPGDGGVYNRLIGDGGFRNRIRTLIARDALVPWDPDKLDLSIWGGKKPVNMTAEEDGRALSWMLSRV
jgi:hypothetical protein